MDLDSLDPSDPKSSRRETSCQFGRIAFADVVGVDPVAEIQGVGPLAAMQAASSDDNTVVECSVVGFSALLPE